MRAPRLAGAPHARPAMRSVARQCRRAEFRAASQTRLSHRIEARQPLNHRVSQKDAALPSYHWPPRANRVATVDRLQHVGQLRCTDRDDAVGRRRPYKAAALEPLGIKRHANAVMSQNFDQMTAFAAKNVEV